MAEDQDIDIDGEDDAEDFTESLAIAHHLAILDLVTIIEGMSGAPADKLGQIRVALTTMLSPDDIETSEQP